MRESDLEQAADLIMPVVPASNPRTVTREALIELLRNAWSGTTPAPETTQP